MRSPLRSLQTDNCDRKQQRHAGYAPVPSSRGVMVLHTFHRPGLVEGPGGHFVFFGKCQISKEYVSFIICSSRVVDATKTTAEELDSPVSAAGESKMNTMPRSV